MPAGPKPTATGHSALAFPVALQRIAAASGELGESQVGSLVRGRIALGGARSRVQRCPAVERWRSEAGGWSRGRGPARAVVAVAPLGRARTGATLPRDEVG